MTALDWLMVGLYLLGMLILAFWSAKRQHSGDDYYLAGRDLSPMALATSTIATQCSTNSLLGAPAFVGFAAGGGMIWLQYELAVPLAMLALAYLMLPMRRAGHISVYEFLEQRLGRNARLLASACFLTFRGVATGVTVYGVAIVLVLLLDISYFWAVVLLMSATIAYDLVGGLRAVVLSDVVQMVLIVLAVLVGLGFLVADAGAGNAFAWERANALSFDPGLTSGNNYGLWPMLFGGFFLYCAYYGCDQSQAQRVLATKSEKDTERVLLINGVLRFPLVFLYCLLGLALAAHAARHPEFLSSLPALSDGAPNINLAFPAFVLERFPAGLVGLVMVGIFAAAMSSIDSALNALSAATIEDFWKSSSPADTTREENTIVAGRIATLGWGVFAVLFSFQVENIAPTVLESINKVGSFANGPLLALFTIALLLPNTPQRWAIAAFFAGVTANFVVSIGCPGVSWLWWNLIGFAVAMAFAALSAQQTRFSSGSRVTGAPDGATTKTLITSFVVIALLCVGISQLAAG